MAVVRAKRNMRYATILIFILVSNVSATTLPKIKMEVLFKMADVVALVEIKQGETIDYDGGSCGAVYKASVIEGFKGVKKEQLIHFGPYHGYKIGYKYLLFLNNPGKVFEPISSTNYRSEAARQKHLLKCKNKLKGLRIMHSGKGAIKIDYTEKYKYKDAAIIPQRYVSFPITLPKKTVDEVRCNKWEECYWVPVERLIKYLNKLKNEL